MSLVNTDTGEVVVMSEADARELIDGLKRAVTIAEGQIIRAWEGRAWLALGYESWDEMVAVEFATHYLKIAPDERRAKAVEMAKAGMSTRAIGSALGVSHPTIVNDLKPGGQHLPPDAQDDPQELEPVRVTGVDGKSYPKPAPKQLTEDEQRAIDLADADARTARYVEKAISNWPALYGLRTNPRRDLVLAHLCESDLAYLADIEGKLQ